MIMRVLVAAAWTAIAVSPATAAPEALSCGHWSLGFETDRDVNLNVGYGIADMTRLIVSGGILSTGDVLVGSQTRENTTSYFAGVSVQRYVLRASTDRMSTFFGGGVGYTASGQTIQNVEIFDIGTVELRTDPGDIFSVNGRCGIEFFPWEPLSVSGHVGVALDVHGKGEVPFSEGIPGTTRGVDFGNDVSTFSALLVTFYWGAE